MTQLLKHGAHGDSVKELQSQLSKLGFEVAADGIFGAGTAASVEELQALFGYEVDAQVGDATQKLIAQQVSLGFDVQKPEAIKKAIEAFGEKTALKRVLKPGAEGADVRFLQRRLVTLGYSLTIDGKFGPATEKAVRAVQQAFGYDVDGSVGQATHKLLNQQIGLSWSAGQPTTRSAPQ